MIVSLTHEGAGVIEEVAERRSAFFRPQVEVEGIRQVIAANLDRLAVVASIKSPAFKAGLIDRFLIAAELGNLEPCIIINKVDLGMKEEQQEIADGYRAIGFPTFQVSAESGEGIDALRAHLKDHRTLFAGHSGVGKSTLLNLLVPGLAQRTREVSDYSNKGKHTTTHIELFPLPDGGYIVDSPGLKVMSVTELDGLDLSHYYPDFARWSESCRFQPCSHSHEPDCEVKAALERGEIYRFRYENYLSILDSL